MIYIDSCRKQVVLLAYAHNELHKVHVFITLGSRKFGLQISFLTRDVWVSRKYVECDNTNYIYNIQGASAVCVING